MMEELQQLKEVMEKLMEKLRRKETLTREQSFLLYGRVATLYECSRLKKDEWRELDDLIPIAIEDLHDIRV